ncbi:MAG: hypothetical protein HYY52_01940 [Candidatus Melainabacteria bacterium]|nr:hypothetical protein [Candidatus Melainabacteria bacterium]
MITTNPITVLEGGRETLLKYLKEKVQLSNEQLDKLKRVKVASGEVNKNGWKFEEDSNGKTNEEILIIKKEVGDLDEIKKELDNGQDSYVPQEGEIQEGALHFLSQIMERAFHRRTTLVGWLEYFFLRSFGFKDDDDFEQVKNKLTSENFVSNLTAYRKAKEDDELKAKESLNTAFGDDKAGIKLAKLASFLLDTYNRLPIGFAKFFPFVFSIQNIAMPWLKSLFPKVKLFDFMVLINPWGYEISECMGNYVKEIQGIHKSLKPNNKEDEKVIGEIEITSLDLNEHKLQRIIKKVDEGFDRLVGKGTTVASWCLTGILKQLGDYKGYQQFAKQFTDDTGEGGFIKKLYASLTNSSDLEKVFDKEPEKYYVAKIVSWATRIAHSVTSEELKYYTNLFGAIFTPLNLSMPILAKFFHKGVLGFLVHTALKFFPLANELIFDHTGNFRKEILDVQKELEDESVAQMFPSIDIKSGVTNLITSFRDFAKKRVVGEAA